LFHQKEDLKAQQQTNTSLQDIYNRYCLIEANIRQFLLQENGEAELLPLPTNQLNDEQTESDASCTRIATKDTQQILPNEEEQEVRYNPDNVDEEEERNSSGLSNLVDEANTVADIIDTSYYATPSTTNYSNIIIIQDMGDNMHKILLQECDTQPSSIKRRGKRDRVRISLSP
jgi:hypothetical protein